MRILVFLILLIPSIVFAEFLDFTDSMIKVEKQIMANNYNEAKEIFLSISDKKFIFENEWAVIGAINYLKSSIEFKKSVKNETEAQEALNFYKEVILKNHRKMPGTLPFSTQVVEKINDVSSENNNILKELEEILESQRLKKQEEKRLKAEEEERNKKEQYLQYQQKELARKEKIEAENKRLQAEYASAEAARKIKEETLKSECGNDYKVVRVGMKFSRVKKCVGNFNLTSQVNRSDGIISTYENKYGFVHVMDNLVVSWGLY